MPTRVLMLITDLKIGGVPLHVYRLATALDPSEFDVRVACLAPRGEVTDLLENAGIPTFACDANGPCDLGAIRRLAGLIRRQRPDLLHAFLFHASTAGCVVGPMCGIAPDRIITEIQTVEIERTWHLVVGGMICRRSLCTVGNSPAVVDHLRRRAHIPASRLRLITSGVDPSRFVDAVPTDRRSLGVPDDASLLMWVGRLDPIKGLDELVDAVGSLADSRVILALVGEGSHERAVRERIDSAGLSDRVLMLGRRDDIPNLLASADVFVFPSRTEGLPNALLEAMAAARPIVTTDAPGCRDLIADEQTGLLAPVGQSAELADRIRRLLDDPELAARLGRNARRHVVERFSFDQTVAAYAELYNHAVSDR